MGLSEPTLTTPRQGLTDQRAGRSAAADDAFFQSVNSELADKGFLVAAADDLIAWARTGSLMW
ncbi:MAG: NADH-quinone oxidoreductase subunit B, partial [Xanthobacteraceae bacterium]